MKYLALVTCLCYMGTCSAVVIDKQGQIVKVDRWGKKVECSKIKQKKGS